MRDSGKALIGTPGVKTGNRFPDLALSRGERVL